MPACSTASTAVLPLYKIGFVSPWQLLLASFDGIYNFDIWTRPLNVKISGNSQEHVHGAVHQCGIARDV